MSADVIPLSRKQVLFPDFIRSALHHITLTQGISLKSAWDNLCEDVYLEMDEETGNPELTAIEICKLRTGQANVRVVVLPGQTLMGAEPEGVDREWEDQCRSLAEAFVNFRP